MGKLICFCNRIKEEEIKDKIETLDLSSIQEIQHHTGAATCCGRCIPLVDKILNNKEQNRMP